MAKVVVVALVVVALVTKVEDAMSEYGEVAVIHSAVEVELTATPA